MKTPTFSLISFQQARENYFYLRKHNINFLIINYLEEINVKSNLIQPLKWELKVNLVRYFF